MGRPLHRIPGPAGALQEALRRGLGRSAAIEDGAGAGPDGVRSGERNDRAQNNDVGTSRDSPWFKLGPWVRLLETLDLNEFAPDSPLLRTNIGWILNGGWRGQRVHRLAAIIVESFQTQFGDLKAVLVDPTGAIRCTIAANVVEMDPAGFRKGTSLLLKEVPVLTVAEYTEHYLCVTPNELIMHFAPEENEDVNEEEARIGGGDGTDGNERLTDAPNVNEDQWLPEPRGDGRPPEELAKEMHDAIMQVQRAQGELDKVRAEEMAKQNAGDGAPQQEAPAQDTEKESNPEPAPVGEVSAFALAAANLLRREN